MSSTASVHPALQQASRFAHAAVEMDNLGNQKEAVDLYGKAIEFLDVALLDPSLPQSSEDVKRCRASYAARVSSLQRSMDGQLELLPQPPQTPAQPSALPKDPTVLQVGVQAVKVANQEGGKYVLQGFQTAKELNEKHHITEAIATGVRKTYDTAVHVNQQYQLVDKVKAGLTNAYTSAKDINEKHQITEKVTTIAAAGVKKVGEIDKEYGITQTIGSAFMSGLNYLATQSHQYLQGSSTSTQRAITDDESTSNPSPPSQPASST